MLLKHKTVAIVGAGPVGLTMAKLLQQEGVAVTVFERDKDAQTRIWGGTLDLHKDSGQLAMQKAGLLEIYYARSIPMGIVMADEQGNILSTVAPQYDNPEINRNALRTMLLESLAKNTVLWDHKLTDLEVNDGRWRLHFEHQPDVSADLVIVANGGMSKVRSYVTDTQIEDTGTFIIQGDIPQPEINCPAFFRKCDGKRLMAAFQGNLLVANPYNNGALSYGIIFRRPDDWYPEIGLDFSDTDSVHTFLAQRCPGWADIYQQLFRSTSFFVGLPTRKLPLHNAWKKDRPLPITLVGDAAHLMPPFAGKGVNTGLTDALILAEALTNGQHLTITAAINDYEQQMHHYAGAAQMDSSQNELELRHPDFSFRQFFREL